MTSRMSDNRVLEQVARDSYSRLLAYLVAQWRDVASAEDALAEAFVSALESWPRMGIPEKPDAWLLTVARRQLIDGARRNRVRNDVIERLVRIEQMVHEDVIKGVEFPDERLKLLFLCAHPAVDARMHAPLMLQLVLRLDAVRISSPFLVRPSTMGQRLSRAKAKIRDARIALELPDAEDLPQRVTAVLDAIYAAYGSGWDNFIPADLHPTGFTEPTGLTGEAIHLGSMLAKLMPGEPEAHGLLALMLHCEARRNARRTPSGQYVPLAEQDVTLWSREMIEKAEYHLGEAARLRSLGRYQLEAAVQSVHAQRAWTGRIEWEEIALLYEGLARVAPTVGTLVGRAAAVAEVRGADSGLALLKDIPPELTINYQPFWALSGHLYTQMRRHDEADAAFSRAIGLSSDASVREFLKQQSGEGDAGSRSRA